MKTKNLIKFASVVFLAFAVSVPAGAQLKGVLNKAKKAVEKKVDQKVDDALDGDSQSTSTTTTSKQSPSSLNSSASKSGKQTAGRTVSQGPEIPELMAREEFKDRGDATDLYLDELSWGLRTADIEQTKALAAKLSKRAEWDTEMLYNMSQGNVQKDEALYAQIRKELRNWAAFYLKIGLISSGMTEVHWEKDAQGRFFYRDVYPKFAIGSFSEQVPPSMKGNIKGNNCMVSKPKDKFIFCYDNGKVLVPDVASDEEIRVAKMDVRMALNIAHLFDGFPIEWWRAQYEGEHNQDDFDHFYWNAILFVEKVSEAIKNNSPANIEYKPMPKPGSMNASMKTKILSLEKSEFPDVVDVVITSNAWEIQKNAAGQPVRRVIYGYSIVNTSNGKMANRVSWAEDHQGGGRYGAVHGYGNGMETFYVK